MRDNLLEIVLERSTRACWRHPGVVLAVCGALTIAGAAVLVRVTPSASITNLIDPSDPAARAFIDLAEHGTALESELLYITTESGEPDPDRLIAFVDRLAGPLEQSPLIAKVDHRLDDLTERFVGELYLPNATAYLSEDALTRLADRLTPESIDRKMARNAAAMYGGASMFVKELIAKDPLELRSVLAGPLLRLRGGYDFDVERGHYLSADGRAILVRVAGVEPAQHIDFAAALLDELRGAIAASDPTGLVVRMGGAYAIAAETAAAIRSDMIWTITAAILLMQLLFAVVYRRWLSFAYVMMPLAAGLIWGFAAFTMMSAELTVITAVGGAMLVGLGVDSAIHILSRHATKVGDGLDAQQRGVMSFVMSGRGVVGAAITTAAGFASFALIGPPGLRALGLLGLVGIFTTLAATLVILPVVVRLFFSPAKGQAAKPPVGFGLHALARWLTAKPSLFLAFAVLVTLASIGVLVLGEHVLPPFERDFRQMHPGQSRSLEVRDDLLAKFGGGVESLFIVIEGASRDQTLRSFRLLQGAIDELMIGGVVSGFASPGMYLPPKEAWPRREAIIRGLDGERVAEDFRAARIRHGFAAEPFEAYEDFLRDSLTHPRLIDVEDFHRAGLAGVFDPFFIDGEAGTTGVATLFLASEGESGGNQAAMIARVTAAVESAAPGAVVTGIGPISLALEGSIRQGFPKVIGYLTLAIAGLVFAQFRRVLHTALVLLPVAVTLVWTLAIMKLAGIDLNLVNVAAFPIAIGIGIDDALHMMYRYRESAATGDGITPMVTSTGHAVMMTTLTTVLGFGSVAIGSTPAVRSFGYVVVIAVVGNLLASIVVLPAVVRVMENRRS